MSRIRAELKDSISSLETKINEVKEFIIAKEAEEIATNAVMDASTLQGLKFEEQVGVSWMKSLLNLEWKTHTLVTQLVT